MADKVTIINRALTTLGAEPITALTEDTTEANVANRVYEESRRSILSERAWTFAMKRVLLNVVTTPLAWNDQNLNFLYQLPSDIIRIFRVNSPAARWRVEQDKLLSDTAGLGILYVFDMTDTTQYASAMVDAFADKLALDMSFFINNSNTTTQQLVEKYEGVSLPKAEGEDSQHAGTPVEINDNLWSTAKFGFSPVDAIGKRIA